MITVIVGLASALVYGAADFLGGTASRRISPVRVTAIAAVTGLVVLLAVLPFVGISVLSSFLPSFQQTLSM